MTFSWPSRAQWQADAADWARTSVLPTERVSADVDAWLSAAEREELLALATRLTRAVRATLGREVRALGADYRDEPTGTLERLTWADNLAADRAPGYGRLTAARSDRSTLHRTLRETTTATTVGRLLMHGQMLARITTRHAPGTDADRISAIIDAVRERRDTAATQAVQADVDAEVARRATDEAWLREQRRRERIEQGPVIVYATAGTRSGLSVPAGTVEP